MKTENTIDFLYQETEIHFLVNPNDKNVMVNATEMAKLFSKPVDNFIRLDGTKKFISSLLKLENSQFVPSDVREQMQESDIIYATNKATFMNRKLALKFAAWLDVDFEVWLFSTIDEILFASNKKIASTVHESQLLEKEEKLIKKRINEQENKDAIRLIEIAIRKKELANIKRQANKDLASQYEMDLD